MHSRCILQPLTRFAYRVCSMALEYSFTSIWPCLIVKVLVTRKEYLQTSGTVTSCAFLFNSANVFSCFCDIMNQFELVAKLRFTSVYVAFKSHTESSHTQRVRAPTTTILPITASIYHGLNYFWIYMIYAPQTSDYQIFAKHLTYPSIMEHFEVTKKRIKRIHSWSI